MIKNIILTFLGITYITSADSNINCRNRVSVNISDIIFGLKGNIPIDIIDSYIAASAGCLKGVDENNLRHQEDQIIAFNTGNNICNSYSSCRWCGSIFENENNCESCCDDCRCVGCEWNRGSRTNYLGYSRVCDDCCVQGIEVCTSYVNDCYGCKMSNEGDKSCKDCCGVCRCEGCSKTNERIGWSKNIYGDYICDDCCEERRLQSNITNIINGDTEFETHIYFNIDVCMDDITPLDSSKSNYINYIDMLNDFSDEFHLCYEDKDKFINSWTSISAHKGLDLNLMVRDEKEPSTLLFGYTSIEISNAQVKTYDSSDSHKSTSHMIFYGSLGFVTISLFAILSTAFVVYIFNKRKRTNAKFISEINNPMQDI